MTTQQRYLPFGKVRTDAGAITQTDFGFTFQRSLPEAGLMDYDARFYVPALGRFSQPDTLVPGAGNPQNLNRYSYVRNNPLRYADPTGHWVETALDIAFIAYDIYDISHNGLDWINGLSLAADIACAVLPIATGGGVVVRAVAHADDAVKLISHTDDALRAVKTLDGLADVAKTVEKVDIINDLASGTSQSKRIAEAMRNGDIGVNILGDEMFEKAYRYFGGKGSAENVAAFARAEQTYLRKTSTDIFRDAVHEGTHALDYIRGIATTEKRAYYFERSFQIIKGRVSEFRNLRDVLKHIVRWY